jgi:hypothetical protein
MAAFIPGASPPEVSIPILIGRMVKEMAPFDKMQSTP